MERILTSEETAVLIATMMQVKSANRARISTKTLKKLSGRTMLTPSFMLRLQGDLPEYGYGIFELDPGGHGVIKISILEAARPITIMSVFGVEGLKASKDHIDNLRMQLYYTQEERDDLHSDEE